MRRHGAGLGSPWSIAVGFDEFTPGDKLKVNNRRKSMVLSFSFVELGIWNLWSEAVWLTPAVVRHNIISKVVGGWSHMLDKFVKLMLFGPHGLETAGVSIVCDGVSIPLYAKLKHLFSDGDGLRAALEWKGASGFKPCFRHWNCLMKNSEIVGRDPDYVEITCNDPARFRRWGPGELESSVDMLAETLRRVRAGTLPAARLESLEKAIGFNATLTGILADVDLRSHVLIGDIAKYDWMHSALQNGVVTDEVFLFCKACRVGGHNFSDISQYLKTEWIFPQSARHAGKGLYHVFDAFRSRSSDKADRLKASASELLGLYSILRHWATVAVGDRADIAPQRASFEAACTVIDIILQAKRGELTTQVASSMLLASMTAFVDLHVAAYGGDDIKPKCHWLFDVAEQMSESDVVLDAFIIEKLHLRCKRNMEPVKNETCMERSVLSGVVNEMFKVALRPITDCLCGHARRYGGTVIADSLVIRGRHISTGDVVFLDATAAITQVCAQEDNELYVVVRKLTFVAQVLERPSAVFKFMSFKPSGDQARRKD